MLFFWYVVLFAINYRVFYSLQADRSVLHGVPHSLHQNRPAIVCPPSLSIQVTCLLEACTVTRALF